MQQSLNIAEGEYLGAFLSRMSSIGYDTYFGFNNSYDGRGYYPFSLSYYEMIEVEDLLPSNHMSYSGLVNKHTLLPLITPTATVQYSHELAAFCERKSRFLLQIHKGDNVSRSLYVCFECLKDQIELNGFCWIKREWLIHGVETCLVHNVGLMYYGCRNCYSGPNIRDLHKKHLSGKCDSCRSILTNDVIAESRYDKFVYSALNRMYPNFSGKLKSKLLFEASYRAGKKDVLAYILSEKKKLRVSLQYHSNDVARMIEGEDVYIVYELFWHIMSMAFDSFDEFDAYVSANTELKTIGCLDSESIIEIPILECI